MAVQSNDGEKSSVFDLSNEGYSLLSKATSVNALSTMTCFLSKNRVRTAKTIFKYKSVSVDSGMRAWA